MVVTVQIPFQVKQPHLLEVPVVSRSVLVFVSRRGKLIRRSGLVEVILLVSLVTERRVLRWWRKGRIEVHCRLLVHRWVRTSLEALVLAHIVQVVVPVLRRWRMRGVHIAVPHVEILLRVGLVLSWETRSWWVIFHITGAWNAESGLRELASKPRREPGLVLLRWMTLEGGLEVGWPMDSEGAAKLSSRLRVSDVLCERVEGF